MEQVGLSPSRIAALADGIFAVAMTLLLIQWRYVISRRLVGDDVPDSACVGCAIASRWA